VRFRRHLTRRDANEPSGREEDVRFRRHLTRRDTNEPSGREEDVRSEGTSRDGARVNRPLPPFTFTEGRLRRRRG